MWENMIKDKLRKQKVSKRSVYKGSILRCTEYKEERYENFLIFADSRNIPDTQIFVNYDGRVVKEGAMLIKIHNYFVDIDTVDDLNEFLKLKKWSHKYCDDGQIFLKTMPNKRNSRYVDSDDLERYFKPETTKKLTFDELKKIRNNGN